MNEPNWKNRTLFHGDNLDFLRAMNSESVDLIATDPPFNKGRDFHATPDSLASGAKFQDRWSWEKDVHREWVDQIEDDHKPLMEAIESARHAHSDGMGAFTEVSGRRCPSTGKSTTPRSRRNGRTMARRRHRSFASRKG